MFRHILIPTDGSEASARASVVGMALAKDDGATVMGLHMMPDMPIYAYQAEILEDTFEQFNRVTQSFADTCLAEFARTATAYAVKYSLVCVRGSEPWRAILQAAESHGIDLIVMASHGRKGMQGLLLGSETHKVLIHGRIPVLVVR